MTTIQRIISAMRPAERALMNIRSIETKARQAIERKYLKRRNNSAIYIALEEVNMIWTPKEVGWFDDMWRSGSSLLFIAAKLKRKPLEVALLIMDRELKGKIKPRKRGIW